MAKSGKPNYSLIDMWRDRLDLTGDGAFPIVDAFKAYFDDLDRDQYIHRYNLFNCPEGINQELIERILYYRGQLCMWYSPEMKKFFVTPFSFVGPPDVVGNFEELIPLPFHGAVEEKDADGNPIPLITGMKKKIIKEIPEVITPDLILNGAVVLWDRSRGISQYVKPRYYINQGLISIMAEMPAMAKTSLLINSGVQGWQVNGPEDGAAVDQAAQTVEAAVLGGYPWIPVKSINTVEGISQPGRADTNQFTSFMNTIDSMRLSGMGIPSTGTADKANTYVDKNTMAIGQANISITYSSGLQARQNWADICNAVWGTVMMWTGSEAVEQVDMDGDGLADDSRDQSGEQGEQPQGGAEDNGD